MIESHDPELIFEPIHLGIFPVLVSSAKIRPEVRPKTTNLMQQHGYPACLGCVPRPGARMPITADPGTPKLFLGVPIGWLFVRGRPLTEGGLGQALPDLLRAKAVRSDGSFQRDLASWDQARGLS